MTKKRGFSIIELVVYIAVTSVVLLILNNSALYFKYKITSRILNSSESVYINRGFQVFDTLMRNAVNTTVSTSSNGFIIDAETYLAKDKFVGQLDSVGVVGRTHFRIECSASSTSCILNINQSPRDFYLFQSPYVHIEDIAINKVIDNIFPKTYNVSIRTARMVYTHRLITFSQLLDK